MKDLLHKISAAEPKSLEQLDELCETVKEYYANNKRHKYSEVSTFLMENADVDYLLENLRLIQERLNESPEDEPISIKVFKLIDHITLELNRSRYNSKNFGEMQISSMDMVLQSASQKIREVTDSLRKEQSQKLASELEAFKCETEELKGKVEDSYSQFVSILGIFSAIVLVFFGGMTAFSSLFANLQNITRFKLVFITALVGMIVFDLVFMFLYVLAKLLKREIAASTTAEATSRNPVWNWIQRMWYRYPYMFIFNATMLAIMSLIFIAWYGSTYLYWRI